MVRATRLAFQGVDSRLEMAARGLGAGPLVAFFTVSLPLKLRILAYLGRAVAEWDIPAVYVTHALYRKYIEHLNALSPPAILLTALSCKPRSFP